MRLPQSLLDAKAAIEAQFQRQATVQQQIGDVASSSAQAAACAAELDREIEAKRDAILEDAALAGIADDQRMAADVRTGTEQMLAMLIAQ